MLKLKNKKLIGTNEIIDNQLKIEYGDKNKIYLLINEGQSYQLLKSDCLIWNIPENIDICDTNIKIQVIDEYTNKNLYTTNEVLINSCDLKNKNIEIYPISLQTTNINLMNCGLSLPMVGTITDQHPVIEIDSDLRKINMPTNYVINVLSDSNSQLLTFQINKYYDGINLIDTAICIKFINANNEYDKAIAINIYESDSFPDKLTFGWLLDSRVSKKIGVVKFSIEFFALNEDNEFYSLNTIPAQFIVEDTIIVDDCAIEERFPTIIEDIQIELRRLYRLIDNIEITVDERDFLTNPIDLETETTGVLQINKIDSSLIDRIIDIENKMNIILSDIVIINGGNSSG